ncbi:hypothetical protein FI667_g6910, partial [Globisporangium splendens]
MSSSSKASMFPIADAAEVATVVRKADSKEDEQEKEEADNARTASDSKLNSLFSSVGGFTLETSFGSLITSVKSARQMKRLGKLATTAAPKEDTVDEVESESDEVEEKRPANMGFAFLVDSDSDSDSDSGRSDGDREGEADDDDEEEEEEEEAPKPVVPVTTAANKKGKNKNKKRGDSEDDVDDILDALAAEASNVSVEVATSMRNQHESSLFSVQLGFVNADKEMKRIFGVRLTAFNALKGYVNAHFDDTNAARVTTKKVQMVTPLDEWPRPPTFVGGGIRWTRANKPKGSSWNNGCNYYEITWSMAYKKSQEEFEILQRTHDPNIIGHFLHRYPFHIDALLQMSEVFQHHGQMDHAADCIKRCMYVLELAWADQFDVAKGNSRMDINAEHNDGFFKALFLLTKQVGRRGCMRSAFETAKLLLGMDPQGDPMNVLLAIDYYALTSRQCQFLIDLCASNLEAADRFRPSEEASTKKNVIKTGAKTGGDEGTISSLPNLQFSLALAHFFLGNADEAKELLAKALLRFPTVLKPLLEKIAANTSSSTWKPILSSRVFANAKTLNDDGLIDHLLAIYISRNHTLWKVNDVQNFLLRGAQHALASPTLFTAFPQVTNLHPSLHKYMRAITNDYSDEVTTLPPDHPMMQPPQFPNGQPMDEEALAALAQAQEQFEAGNLPADANPLLLFLQTLLPWNHVQGARPPQGEGDRQ